MAWTDQEAPQEAPAPRGGGWSTEAPRQRDYSDIIARAAKKYDLDPLLLHAQVKRESSGNPNRVSPAGAMGLMQLMPGTAKDLGVTDAFDPEQNIMGGARYMRQLLDRPDVKGDYGKALLYYVGGRDPKNWGVQSFAYPSLVLDEYRRLGGVAADPRVKSASLLDLAANAAVPFGLGTSAVIRAVKGRGPDLSQGLTGPDANLPVGQKFMNWWRGEGPGDRAVQDFQDSLAKRRTENPMLSMATEIGAGLPGSILLGGAVNKGLEAAGSAIPRVAPLTNFLLGKAGYGLPGTREGASFATRMMSNATQGVVQGGIGAAASAHTNPEQDLLPQVGLGALAGGALGLGGNALAEGIGKGLFGPRINPKVAEAGLEAIQGGSNGLPPLPLRPDPGQANRLALEPAVAARAAAKLYGEAEPIAGPAATNRVATRIGNELDAAASNAAVAVDRQTLTDFNNILLREDRRVAQKPVFREIARALNSTAITGGNEIPGELYRKWTMKGGVLERAIGAGDSALANAAKDVKQVLDDGLERGMRQRVRMAVAQGDTQGVLDAQEALLRMTRAKQQYKALATVREVADPITGEFAPRDLMEAALRHNKQMDRTGGGPMGALARYGQAFDATDRAPAGRSLLPWSGMAALGGMLHFPMTTGGAAVAGLGAYGAGKGARAIAAALPGYVNALLQRSARVGPGALQQGMNATSLPLVGAEVNKVPWSGVPGVGIGSEFPYLERRPR